MTQPLWTVNEIQGMHLELTDKCNAACPMCPRYLYEGTVNPHLELVDVSLENFRTWFPPDFIKQLRRVYACGNYGDPIAAKDCLEIFQYMRENNSEHLSLTLHTNGSARNPDWWYKLGLTMNQNTGYRNDYCVFSIDGLADTNHLYRRNTNFAKIMENVKAFASAGGKMQWDYIVFEHNEHQVEEAKALAKELGFSYFNIKRTTRWSEHDEKGVGFRKVLNKKGDVDYLLRQPSNVDYRNENAVNLKQKIQTIIPVKVEAPKELVEARIFDPESKKQLVFDWRDLEVACRAQDVSKGGNNSINEIFLSATGHVFPCCFLGGTPWVYDGWNEKGGFRSQDTFTNMIHKNGGLDSISLHKHTLAEIVASDIYTTMVPESFAPGHSERSRQCSMCCGKEWNTLDFGELGTKFTDNKRARDRQ